MEQKLVLFKNAAFKIGAAMTVFFISRLVCAVAASLLLTNDNTLTYILAQPLQDLFLYIIPIGFALFLFRPVKIGSFYKKPPRMAKALGNFPAVYGLGQMTNLLFMLVIFIISKFTPDNLDLQKSFGTMESIRPPNMFCAVVLALRMVVCAPLFEEFFTRGIILNALKPYGEGFAIMISGFMFGLMHGNLQQFAYAFVIGIALGYIAVQTDSILPTTILHALFNSILAGMLLFASTDPVRRLLSEESEKKLGKIIIPDSDMLVLAFYGMFTALFLILAVAGIALAVRKITRINFYKISNEFTEVSAAKKTAVFAAAVPVIIMLAFAIDAFAGSLAARYILSIIRG